MIGAVISDVEKLRHEVKKQAERIAELENNYNELVKLLGVNPPSAAAATAAATRRRPRSPSPNHHHHHGYHRRRTERSRSRRRSPRSRSRSRSPGEVAPLSEAERDALPGVHVSFDRTAKRWTAAEADEFGSTFGKVRHVYVPDNSAQRWLHINFAEVADRDACLDSTLVHDHYPGVTLKRKFTRKEMEEGGGAQPYRDSR